MKFIITMIACLLTLAASAIAATQNTINIDPDITNPLCGLTYAKNVNVKNRAKLQDVSPICDQLATYIQTGTKSKDVDLVYLCDGTPEPISGYGSRDVKFIVYGPVVHDSITAATAFDSRKDTVPATLHVLDNHGTDFTLPIEIGYNAEGLYPKWQFIIC